MGGEKKREVEEKRWKREIEGRGRGEEKRREQTKRREEKR